MLEWLYFGAHITSWYRILLWVVGIVGQITSSKILRFGCVVVNFNPAVALPKIVHVVCLIDHHHLVNDPFGILNFFGAAAEQSYSCKKKNNMFDNSHISCI